MPTEIKVAKDALSIVEFCSLYSVCRSTVLGEIKKQKLKAKKVGSRILIRVEDAQEWAKELPDFIP